jgi:hypothetical protein
MGSPALHSGRRIDEILAPRSQALLVTSYSEIDTLVPKLLLRNAFGREAPLPRRGCLRVGFGVES